MKYSTLGFGFMVALIIILWIGAVPAKPTLILATIGAVIIIVEYLIKNLTQND